MGFDRYDRAIMKTQERQDDLNTQPAASFLRLYDIIETLRGADGCAWDREQTTSSLRDSLIEECYECVEAISDSSTAGTREELGDVFLIATMMSYIEQQSGNFTVSDVLEEISDKLVRRHPHVFGESDATTPDEIITQWNEIKATEKKNAGKTKRTSILDRISRAAPPLRYAWEMQKKAAKTGFDWPDRSGIIDKIHEELGELSDAREISDSEERHRAVEEEIGDLLFTVVNLARADGIEPDIALHRANTKFSRRFRAVEHGMAERSLEMRAEHLETMESLWEKAKRDPADSADFG
jgi:tetrapyrrole methylase family protein / MazG family protein